MTEYIQKLREALENMRPAGSVMTAECLNGLIDAALALAVPEPEKEWGVKWPSGRIDIYPTESGAQYCNSQFTGGSIFWRMKGIPPGPWEKEPVVEESVSKESLHTETCGDCRHWMIKSECPPEAAGSFIHCNSSACEKFSVSAHAMKSEIADPDAATGTADDNLPRSDEADPEALSDARFIVEALLEECRGTSCRLLDRIEDTEQWLRGNDSLPLKTRNSLALASFTEYCRLNPEQRFWQALRNWSKWNFILAAEVRDGATLNTFHLEGLDGTRTADPLPRAVVDAPRKYQVPKVPPVDVLPDSACTVEGKMPAFVWSAIVRLVDRCEAHGDSGAAELKRDLAGCRGMVRVPAVVDAPRCERCAGTKRVVIACSSVACAIAGMHTRTCVAYFGEPCPACKAEGENAQG